MAFSIFGFQFNKSSSVPDAEKIPSIAPTTKDDGAIVISSPGPMAAGLFLDLEGSVKNESELVTKYRDMSIHPEIDNAVDEIVNEALVSEDGEKPVDIVLDEVEISESFKKVIRDEFDEVLRLLEFHTMSYEVFRKWYVDGRLYYVVVVDPNNASEGIAELRYLDPRKIRKIRQVKQSKDKKSSALLTKTEAEFYVYSDKALLSGPMTQQLQNFSLSSNGVKITKDAIVHITSGLTNSQNTLVLSYLHKAIKPLNQLRSMEDSLVIYRISRAPERRVFYIDVGHLPHAKSEQYVKDIINKHKSKVIYNAETGQIQSQTKFMTMLEDFYIPMREGNRGARIDTLPGGKSLGETSDVEYFLNKLYNSLNVPISRLNPEYLYNIGRSNQITRDEIKFSKFINRLRLRFSALFLQVLQKNLILKGKLSVEEWREIEHLIKFKYARDNYYAELKDSEIQSNRVDLLNQVAPYIGRFYSNAEVRKDILKQTEDDVERIDAEIVEEMNNPQYNPAEAVPENDEYNK